MITRNEKSLFVAFEGVEGSGKSTIISRLKQDLQNRLMINDTQYDVSNFSDPGSTQLGIDIKRLLMSSDHTSNEKPLNSICEAYLFCAARARLVDECIGPALSYGDDKHAKLVLCDRYYDSNLVYQTLSEPKLTREQILALNSLATEYRYTDSLTNTSMYFSCDPDITIVLDIDPAVTLKRQRENHCETNSFDARELSFHQKVRQSYLDLAKTIPKLYYIIDASRSLDDVYNDVRQCILNKLNSLNSKR